MYRILTNSWLPPEVHEAFVGRLEIDAPGERDVDRKTDALMERLGAQGWDGVLLLRPLRAGAEFFAACRSAGVRAVANFGVGYDNVDLDCATAAGIPVVNTPRSVTEATADTALLLMLSVMRGAGRLERDLRETHRFPMDRFYAGATGLYGKTLGIVGLGRIGQAVARRAKSCGMDVAYTQRRRAAAETEAACAARFMPLDGLLETCDVLSLHVPLTAETRHLIDERALSRMRAGSYLINVSRGPVVCEAALVEALRSGRLAGAGLDVYEFEPKITEALYGMENVMLLPHAGTLARDVRVGVAREALEGLYALLGGERPESCLNMQVLG